MANLLRVPAIVLLLSEEDVAPPAMTKDDDEGRGRRRLKLRRMILLTIRLATRIFLCHSCVVSLGLGQCDGDGREVQTWRVMLAWLTEHDSRFWTMLDTGFTRSSLNVFISEPVYRKRSGM